MKNCIFRSACILLVIFFFGLQSYAGTLFSDRIAVEAGVKAEIAKDLSQPVQFLKLTLDRVALMDVR